MVDQSSKLAAQIRAFFSKVLILSLTENLHRNKIPFKSQTTQATIHTLRLPFNFSPAHSSHQLPNYLTRTKKNFSLKKRKLLLPLTNTKGGVWGGKRDTYYLGQWREESIFLKKATGRECAQWLINKPLIKKEDCKFRLPIKRQNNQAYLFQSAVSPKV